MSGAPVNISQAFQTLDWLSSEESNKFPLQALSATYNKLNFCFADIFYLSQEEKKNVISQSAVSSYTRCATALRHESFYTDAARKTVGTQLHCTCHSLSNPHCPKFSLRFFLPIIAFILGAAFRAASGS